MKTIACAIGLGFLVPSVAIAQGGVATLSYADAGLTRMHRGAPSPAAAGISLIDGDQLQTANGRAEIAIAGGTFVHLDAHAKLVVRGDRAELLDGRVSVRTGSARPYLVDVATAHLNIQRGSVVEIASRADVRDMDLRVINGAVQVDTPSGSARVPDYKRCYVAGPGSAPSVTNVLPTAAGDFERWALSRQVLAESTPLKGTENGGGVAYAPWTNSYFAYAAPLYYQPVYYSYPYYPYYPYYGYYYPTSPSYPSYATPYYASSYYYAPSRSYYYGGYGSYYSGSSRERYTWSTPPEPLATPKAAPGAAPAPAAPGASKGAVIPKP